MSNSLTVHNATIIAQEALNVLRANLFLAKRIRRDYEEDVKIYGNVVTIPKFGTLAANDKAAGGSRTVQDVTSGSVSVTLNKHKEASFLIEDPERAFSRNDLIQGYTISGMTAILEAVESDIFALYAGLSQTVGSSGTALSESNILAVRKLLRDAKAPIDDNFTLALSTTDYSTALGLDRFTSADKIGAAGKIADGALGKIHGFQTFESQLVKVATGRHNLAFHRDAFALVVRPLPEIPAGMGTIGTVVSDPDSGLAVRVRMNYDADRGGIVTTVEILYGVAECRDELAVDYIC